jgi:hypothetical protein
MNDGPKQIIAAKVGDLQPVLAAWRKEHPGVSWSWLLRAALKHYLANGQTRVGKRNAHLLTTKS